MKRFRFLLFFVWPVVVAAAQTNSTGSRLLGAVNVPPVKEAVFQIEIANREYWQSDQMILGEGQAFGDVAVSKIGAVNVQLQAAEQSLTLELPKTNALGISLRDIELQTTISLYQQLKGRTVLQHPKLPKELFSISSDSKTADGAAVDFERMFAEKGIATIPDGDKFVMLVPVGLTNSVKPRSKDIQQNGPLLPSQSIHFVGAPLNNALEVYAQYMGWELVNGHESAGAQGVYLIQATPLSKADICYAMETLFTWSGIRFVPVDDKKFKWEAIPGVFEMQGPCPP